MKPVIVSMIVAAAFAFIAWFIMLKITSDFAYMHQKELAQEDSAKPAADSQ